MTAADAIIHLTNPQAAFAAWGIPFVSVAPVGAASGSERVR